MSGNASGSIAMINLYYWPTPNGWKITILLEELGLDYNVIAINILEKFIESKFAYSLH